MGRQIIKQPNGKYCIYSSTVESVTHVNLSAEQIIDMWSLEAKCEIMHTVNGIIKKLEQGENPYQQFTLTWDDLPISKGNGVLIKMEGDVFTKESFFEANSDPDVEPLTNEEIELVKNLQIGETVTIGLIEIEGVSIN